MSTLWLDRETWCELDLKAVGTYQYAAFAEDLLIAYAIDDGPAMVWDATAEPIHPELERAMRDATEVWAHNAQFDKAVHRGSAQAALPSIATPRWRCSMAQALSHALPAALSDLCDVLQVPEDQSKLAEGKKLVALFTRPQPANRKVRRATRETHPAEWERFKAYAVNDIVAMRECVRRMPVWNWSASAVAEWHCDQRINERGFAVDRELARAGAAAAIVEKERIGQRFRALTGGVVDRPSQREQFKAFIKAEFGLALDDTKSDTFNQLLKDKTLDPKLAELMRLSIASNKTSTAKYAALEPAIQADDRFRGGLQFAGAARTRRWAGRLFQPQNLPSRGLPDASEIERYIDHLKLGSHDLFFDNLMLFGAAALRGLVVAPTGKKLVVADLSNIEGRVLAWVSGEQWKLDAFRAYDAGTGPDLYNVTAVSIIGGDPWKVEKKNRNVFGKVPDLASGYMGGVAGYQTFAHAYGVRMADYWDVIQRMIDPKHVEQARKNLASWGFKQLDDLEISEIEWIASETCKLAWRARHPATVKFWYALGNAARDAITCPGTVWPVGKFIKVGCVQHAGQRWLAVKLPSGRYITYFNPQIVDGTISYEGEAAEAGKTSRNWTRVWTHGGKMTGNCLSKTARILTAAGVKPISEVTAYDHVWDGVEWVGTDGVISQGQKEVGTWLGVEITANHLIHDGKSWLPVMQLGERFQRDALASAACSVASPSFAVTPRTVAMQNAFVLAAASMRYPFANCGAVKACGAAPVRLRQCPQIGSATPPSQTPSSGHCGETATNTWSLGATTPGTRHTETTADVGSPCLSLGCGIGCASSTTCGNCLTGMCSASTLTVSTTTEAMNPGTCDSLTEKPTVTTDAPIAGSNMKGSNGPWHSSATLFAQSGQAQTPSRTTCLSDARPLTLWAATGRQEAVFDLLNCGPRNRFTVVTDAGPVIVHNCCQTLARDILAPTLEEAERRGYTPILTVHDEILTEAPDTPEFNADGLAGILAHNPAWAGGLPLAAAAFEATRYKKD